MLIHCMQVVVGAVVVVVEEVAATNGLKNHQAAAEVDGLQRPMEGKVIEMRETSGTTTSTQCLQIQQQQTVTVSRVNKIQGAVIPAIQQRFLRRAPVGSIRNFKWVEVHYVILVM